MPRMSENDRAEVTQADTLDIESTAQGAASPRRSRLVYALLIYIAAMLVVGFLAFTQGRGINVETQSAAVAQALYEQFELGVADLEAGRYQIAHQRFEAIIRYDPAYPGAEDMLVEALIHLNVPTITPTALPTPTPDPSPPDQLLAQAEAAITAGDWDTAINKLLSLRAKDANFKTLRVDGLMYIALRNRGMILISQGSMEEGLYNLSLAARFGPLDRDALFHGDSRPPVHPRQ